MPVVCFQVAALQRIAPLPLLQELLVDGCSGCEPAVLLAAAGAAFPGLAYLLVHDLGGGTGQATDLEGAAVAAGGPPCWCGSNPLWPSRSNSAMMDPRGYDLVLAVSVVVVAGCRGLQAAHAGCDLLCAQHVTWCVPSMWPAVCPACSLQLALLHSLVLPVRKVMLSQQSNARCHCLPGRTADTGCALPAGQPAFSHLASVVLTSLDHIPLAQLAAMSALRRLDVSGCGCPSGRLELPRSLQGLTLLVANGMHEVGGPAAGGGQ